MKVLLIDDHVVVREGVRRLLSSVHGIEVSEASNGHEALSALRLETPDVILLDLNLEGMGGLELLRRMLAENDRLRIIVFSMHSDTMYAARAMRFGARGYVSKSASADELVAAVKRVAEGGRYVEREIAEQLAFAPAGIEDPLRQLSAREMEILRLLGDGKSMAAIADTLGVAYKTVANTCSSMKTKLGLSRTADLIRLSIESRSLQ